MLAGSGLTRQPAGAMKTSPSVTDTLNKGNRISESGWGKYLKQYFHGSYTPDLVLLSFSLETLQLSNSFPSAQQEEGAVQKQIR